VPAAGWTYNPDGTGISLTTGNFVANDIYEFSYTAKDPTVNGLGFAAVRDWNAWLRYATGTISATAIRSPATSSASTRRCVAARAPAERLPPPGLQRGRERQKVFDGLMQWIAAGNGLNLNYRFSQPGARAQPAGSPLRRGRVPVRQREDYDPITRRVDSRYTRCPKTGTCPLAVEIYSSNEYWVKTASLLHTDPTGTFDLADRPTRGTT